MPDVHGSRRKFLMRSLGLPVAFSTSSFSFLGKAWSFVAPHLARARKVGPVFTGLYSFGDNTNGNLGDNTLVNKSSPVRVGSATTWLSVAGCKDSSVSIENWHSVAVRGDGTLWAWGNSNFGKLGNGGSGADYKSPVKIGSLTTWKQVSAGSDCSAGVRTDGALFTWGTGFYGQLGLKNTNDYSSPVRVGTLSDWQMISISTYHFLGIRGTAGVGSVWFTGFDSNGMGGQGAPSYVSSPIQVGSLTTWKFVTTGVSSSFGIQTDGKLWGWGSNASGQLGTGTLSSTIFVPTSVTTATDWVTVSSHRYHSAGIRGTAGGGTLWTWGDNTNGKLGAGDTVRRSTPFQIGSASDWIDVSCGEEYTVGVRADGTLWAWGLNTWGNLGTGNITSFSSPVQVGSGTTWSKVAAGYRHAFGIRTS